MEFFTRMGDYQVLVCRKSQLSERQGLAAAVGVLPVSSKMFLKIVSDCLCSNPAGLCRVSLGHLVPEGARAGRVDKQTILL